ncbi:MAG: sporulation integral membrane protein YlbJ [Terrisporobacter othiniensis]|uniref:Sporulation integral membrane protein YlbJ n=1 Tax=Terrisporobacter hibernicus TaxID=2813371 RepID=A0AAX2ZFI3_9FIRM|nr:MULTISPECIES: sporulation integral membrane protein YlbJ [Terrisporobacter]MDU4859537.1 sporulation integral membrane protein YlbJ [Terrisporobacter othiniensis]MDU6993924.1 sporulation integral membrane protein YlbJ [Terrisporobacter othiniensis]UEL46819.1 sporulation integral membrane protein YlbJ [Terrisporobacter hibernicus]
MNIYKLTKYFLPKVIVLLLIIGIIIFPNDSIEAAANGIHIWVNILMPSLLPFIIGANLIVSLRVVDIIGAIINPITQLVFNISGKSALVFAISAVSGYPVGARLASDLRLKQDISQYEGQRLVSFCSTSGPLFIIGAVAVGMLKDASLGYVMLICHYLGAITVGLLFRRYGNEKRGRSNITIVNNIKYIINTPEKDGFFISFGNAVISGVNTLLAVGGFVIIFSVVFKILTLFNVIDGISSVVCFLLSFLGITKEVCSAFISGLFEITIGCNNIANITYIPEAIKASLCSFIIGFSGLSILAQCCSFIAKTDINTNIYIFNKFLHGTFAALYTFLLYPLSKNYLPVSNFSSIYNSVYNNNVLNHYFYNFKIFLIITVIIYIIFNLYFLYITKD